MSLALAILNLCCPSLSSFFPAGKSLHVEVCFVFGLYSFLWVGLVWCVTSLCCLFSLSFPLTFLKFLWSLSISVDYCPSCEIIRARALLHFLFFSRLSQYMASHNTPRNSERPPPQWDEKSRSINASSSAKSTGHNVDDHICSNKIVTDEKVECEICVKWYHFKCIQFSKGVVKIRTLLGIHWYCSQCDISSLITIKFKNFKIYE